ncbi:MAG: YutD family protein [Turicibacter sp.]|nr:YutD family protein [Turicibacter sp.]
MTRHNYQVVKKHMCEFDELVFRQKYTEVFDKYDYLVGDFSGGQLRLKGFYREGRKGIPPEQRVESIPDYLAEYCAYGCPYYVIEKIIMKVIK